MPVAQLCPTTSPSTSECMEGVSDFGEVPDEPLVEVHKSYEGLDVLYFHWLWPVCDSLDFNRVHHYMVFGDDESEVVHLLMFKFAFLWSEEQLVGVEVWSISRVILRWSAREAE